MSIQDEESYRFNFLQQYRYNLYLICLNSPLLLLYLVFVSLLPASLPFSLVKFKKDLSTFSGISSSDQILLVGVLSLFPQQSTHSLSLISSPLSIIIFHNILYFSSRVFLVCSCSRLSLTTIIFSISKGPPFKNLDKVFAYNIQSSQDTRIFLYNRNSLLPTFKLPNISLRPWQAPEVEPLGEEPSSSVWLKSQQVSPLLNTVPEYERRFLLQFHHGVALNAYISELLVSARKSQYQFQRQRAALAACVANMKDHVTSVSKLYSRVEKELSAQQKGLILFFIPLSLPVATVFTCHSLCIHLSLTM